MSSIFNRVQAPSLQKYDYNLSHEFKLSTNFGRLTPIAMQEVIPGDTFKMNTEVFMRMAPLIHPILQRMHVDVHHFFVPYRIIWDGFEEFITGFKSRDTAGPLVTTLPKITFRMDMGEDDIFNPNSLPHYFGAPLCFAKGERKDLDLNALPFRAYCQIYNDYYRDSIKQSPIDFPKDSLNVVYENDPDNPAWQLTRNRLRCYGQDYFTTAQPNPQLGDPAVLPAPVINTSWSTSGEEFGDGNIRASAYSHLNIGNYEVELTNEKDNQFNYVAATGWDENTNKLTSEPFTINKLKELFSLQKLFDVGNRFGSRYAEQTLGHFGVRSSDARLQRAQYLGGGRIPVMINQISQMSEGTEDSPLGYQAGQGMAQGADNYFNETFEEHGVIISILSIIPEANYTRGISKFLLKTDRYDFAFPELSTIGEQEVSAQEYNIHSAESEVYGYQERYAEYKTAFSRCAGDFLTTLQNFYVQTNQVQAVSVMDLPFVVDPRDLQNIFAITDADEDKFYIQAYHNIHKSCVLPYLNRGVNPTSWV